MFNSFADIIFEMVKLGSFTAESLYRVHYQLPDNEILSYPVRVNDLAYLLDVMHNNGLLELSVDGSNRFYTLPNNK